MLGGSAAVDLGGTVYHEFLQFAFLDWIALTHGGTWRVTVDRFEFGTGEQAQFGPAPDAADYKVTLLNVEDMRNRFGANRFAHLRVGGFGSLALPPNTKLAITPPHSDQRLGEVGDITLTNRFCEIKIQSRSSSWGIGLGGYVMLLGIPPEIAQEKYAEHQYIVRISASFSPYLVGHPSMAAHRKWARDIVDGLTHAFGEETLWRRTAENFMLRQHLPAQPRPEGVFPMRFRPPASPNTSAPTKK